MKLKQCYLPILAAVSLCVASGSVSAEDGAAIFTGKSCIACHGADGNTPTNSEIPKIGGQNRDYLINQLRHFKNGERTAGNALQMKGIASILTDEDIIALADFLSSQEGLN